MPDQTNQPQESAQPDEQILNDVREQMNKLPQIVQDAITSPELDEKLRKLSEAHQLHLDKWTSLENQVVLILMGIDPSEELQANIEKNVGVSPEEAASLAQDISDQIFEPLRMALEKESPAAETAPQPAPERIAIVTPRPTPAPILPATPPAPKPDQKVERAPVSSSYAASTPSHERTTIEGDPYREQI